MQNTKPWHFPAYQRLKEPKARRYLRYAFKHHHGQIEMKLKKFNTRDF
jgi:hypothetical protein